MSQVPTTTDKKIHSLMTAIQADAKAINPAEGLEAVHDGLQHLFSRHGVLCMSRIIDHSHEVKSHNGKLTATTTANAKFMFIAPDGSSVLNQAIGVSTGSLPYLSNDDLLLARKHALLQVFLISLESPAQPVQMPSKGQQAVEKIMTQAGAVTVTTADQLPAPTPQEMEAAKQALLQWQNEADQLSIEEPGQWDAHRDKLKALRHIKPQEKIDLFEKLRQKGAGYGVAFDEKRKMFYLADVSAMAE